MAVHTHQVMLVAAKDSGKLYAMKSLSKVTLPQTLSRARARALTLTLQGDPNPNLNSSPSPNP